MRWTPAFILPILLVAGGCRSSTARSHETCVKEAIFATQRATEKLSNATEYADAVAAIESLKLESDVLNRLRDEFSAFSPPSSWERSRMRRHRSLLASANPKWAAAAVSMRQRLDEGLFPPDIRQKIEDAMTAFEEAHKQFWSTVEPLWD